MIKRKNGELLTETIIFVVLNLVFITILIVFIFTKTSDVSRMEEKYAKEIALIIDSLGPLSEVKLDMNDAFEKAPENLRESLVIIDDDKNLVVVKLQERGRGYSYSFFNDVRVSAFRSGGSEYTIRIFSRENE